MDIRDKILNLIHSIGGVQFCFLTYRTKETFYKTSEICQYKLNIGASINNLYQSDINTLNSLDVQTIANNNQFSGISQNDILLAKNEILLSLNESLDLGIGNNTKFTKQGYFNHINNNLKYAINDTSNELTLYFNALIEERKVLLPATIKKVKNSKDKTIAKQLINSNYLKRSKIANFIISEKQIRKIAVNKQVLIIDTIN